MPKRKLLSFQRGSIKKEEEDTDSDFSDSETLTKRIKPDLSPPNSDEECYSSDTNQANLLSSDVDDEQNDNVSDSAKNLQNNSGTDTDTEKVNEIEYDSYRSFMKSFQFFSDQESSESDTQDQFLRNFTLTKATGNISQREKELRDQSQKKQAANLKEQSEYALFNEDNVRVQTISDSVRVLGYYLKNLEIIFMDHPSSVPIVGYLKVTLIAGKASIQGYKLKVNKPIIVFSQKQTGILSVTSHSCDDETACTEEDNVRNKLSHYLLGVPASHIKDYIKKNMNYSSTVFILQSIILSSPLQFLQVYSPCATSFEKKKKKKLNNEELKTKFTGFTEKQENILEFGSEYEEIFSTIHKHLLRINRRKPGESRLTPTDSEESEDDLRNEPDFKKVTGFRILISGPRKAGKSTMLRYLVNSFLNRYPEVYYLDTDPGQSEFTPPGGISLVKVTQPLFGPAYSHIKKPVKMIFTGTITPETSPPMHMRSITRMIKTFNSHFPDKILVVNTIGWLTGVGNLIHEHIKKTLLPVVEIELSSSLSDLEMTLEGRLLRCSVGFERDAATSTKQGDNRPQDLRDWALLSYIGQCQTYFLQPHTLNEFRPACICWDNIAVYNFNKRLMHNRYYEALNASVVALCHVKESCILTPTSPDYPLTLEEEPDNDCLGYGFVRAVDEEQHLLYIVTPLSCNTLNDRVNAILSGNILIPRDVIYKQKILNVELDYTDGSTEGRTELRKAIRKRSRGHSSKDRRF
ncbi:polynucleotide 5'-hydroxyl-kinase NOL9 [Parasteatoda tepidariorum]|uniref:polynucleotide 5'-hydroxyl-kinase NOL9 n=1 Tax=Parasteatoda tepidariorum TaxID=114398 RepID=UPI001C724805|nr:polynucleotide 5'-hydroxyl-kinase NOL9 [Parasteatoda tepidariorum]XP_042897523.1 polynucleotide 5'-hydroxyl-kinase NOL9 [Parasteatoda tepidariorum]